jgi:hypothetical protein
MIVIHISSASNTFLFTTVLVINLPLGRLKEKNIGKNKQRQLNGKKEMKKGFQVQVHIV